MSVDTINFNEELAVDFDGDEINDVESEPPKQKTTKRTSKTSTTTTATNQKSIMEKRTSTAQRQQRERLELTPEIIQYVQNKILPSKCFQDEVRAEKDVQLFLRKPSVLLLYNEPKLTINDMIQAMVKEICPKQFAINEICNSIYVDKYGFQFLNYIQGIYVADKLAEFSAHDHTWCCVFASINTITEHRILITRFSKPTNFGPTLSLIRFIVLILAPKQVKATKSAIEIARTFATLMSDGPTRNRLLEAGDEKRFVEIINEQLDIFRTIPASLQPQLSVKVQNEEHDERPPRFRCSFGKGIKENVSRRIRYYWSDYRDGLDSGQTLAKVCSATMSLFFACIMPCLAFGVVNSKSTDNMIGPKEALLGQAIGGLVFALFSGQPLVIIATTAPLCLYTEIVHRIAGNMQTVDFLDLFAMVGIWNSIFCIIYSLFDLSQLMCFCTRSTEEIFSTFIFFAFAYDAIKQCAKSFEDYYCFVSDPLCAPEKSILFLFLMLATFILGLMLYKFSETPFLSPFFRNNLADYSLPLSVIIFSLVSNYVFEDIDSESFQVPEEYRWRIATFQTLTMQSILLSMLLGFALSILFFIDQNVSAALVQAPGNRLKKGDAYHWDLFVVAILNLFLSLAGFPWMHGILPHSPMHARALADVITISGGQQQQSQQPLLTDLSAAPLIDGQIVIRSRETRVTGILIHLLIALVVCYMPWILSHIPVAVLCGLFLYCASSTLRNNSLWDRVLLLFTEQKIVHQFTMVQVLQLLVICFFGLIAPWEYVRLLFPLIIACLIPIRWLILPKLFSQRYLFLIDNKHN